MPRPGFMEMSEKEKAMNCSGTKGHEVYRWFSPVGQPCGHAHRRSVCLQVVCSCRKRVSVRVSNRLKVGLDRPRVHAAMRWMNGASCQEITALDAARGRRPPGGDLLPLVYGDLLELDAALDRLANEFPVALAFVRCRSSAIWVTRQKPRASLVGLPTGTGRSPGPGSPTRSPAGNPKNSRILWRTPGPNGALGEETLTRR